MSDVQRTLRIARIAAVVAVVVGLALAQRFGVFHELAEPARLADKLVRLGPWGWAAFVVAYAALQPFGVPGTVFVFAAPLIWPWPTAFALSMTGTMAASVVGFSFARFVARDWLSSKVPARFRRFDDALARRAFATVFWLRLVFWMPPLLHAFFGVSRVPFATHFWASLAGYAPTLLLVSYFGARLASALRGAAPSTWAAIAAAMIAVVVTAWTIRRSLARRAPPGDVSAEPGDA